MRLDRLTQKSQEALQLAQELASEHNNSQIEVEHLFLALLEQEESLVANILATLGVPVSTLKGELQQSIEKLPRMYSTSATGQVYISAQLKNVLERAWQEAQRLKDEYISVEHLLLGIAEEKGCRAQELLLNYGATKDKIYGALQKIRGNQRVTDPEPETKYQVLQKYSRDLTELARKGKLDPVIGREEETVE